MEKNSFQEMNNELYDIVINYLKGNITEEETVKLKSFIAESSSNKKVFDEICDVWYATVSPKNKAVFDSLEALKNVRKRLQFVSKKPKNWFLEGKAVVYRVAALVVVAFGLGFFVNYFFSLDASSKDALTEISAPIGSKSKITMPDGSKVVLNAGSTISYNAGFNRENRDVTLKGEAYFDVSKNKEVPFMVKTTSAIQIKVLGTAFNVKAYPNEGTVETTLVRGSLIVEHTKTDKSTQTLLAPNQRATFIKSEGLVYLSDIDSHLKNDTQHLEQLKGKVLFSKHVDTDLFTAWKDGKLVFRNERFESLAVKLERWYGVKILIDNDEIKNFHFNGTIENETINDVMEIIAYTLPIQFNIQHNVISITSQNKK